MLPIVSRSAEVVLLLVPDSLREAALALGAPRWRVVTRVVLPTALPGLVTGSLLAVARAAGETAPLLFTASIVNNTTFDLSQPMGSLPALIFQDVCQPRDELIQIAWGAALTLVLMILILTLIARAIQRRTRRKERRDMNYDPSQLMTDPPEQQQRSTESAAPATPGAPVATVQPGGSTAGRRRPAASASRT